MSHQDTLVVSKSWSELHNVLCEGVNGVVILLRRSVSLSIAPHVNGYHMIVHTELRQLVTPREPELHKNNIKLCMCIMQ